MGIYLAYAVTTKSKTIKNVRGVLYHPSSEQIPKVNRFSGPCRIGRASCSQSSFM